MLAGPTIAMSHGVSQNNVLKHLTICSCKREVSFHRCKECLMSFPETKLIAITLNNYGQLTAQHSYLVKSYFVKQFGFQKNLLG